MKKRHKQIELPATPSVLPRYWEATGFTPATLLFEPEMQEQLSRLANIPGTPIRYLRMHYLLDLVGVGAFAWNYDRLDTALDLVVRRFGFRLIFELMGNPGGVFSDFGNDDQLRLWFEFTKDLLRHLIDRYGREEVAGWCFESWNEPDLDMWWPQWPDSHLFCRYYDACAAAVDAELPEGRFGGPATCKTTSEVFVSFLRHVAQDKNRLTGDPIRLDFVSIHEKGAPPSADDLVPSVHRIITRTEKARSMALSVSESFNGIPWMNNECDPQVGWEDLHYWRETAYYPAMIVKTIHTHLPMALGSPPLMLLSNDNAFLGTWGQRSLFVLFRNPNPVTEGSQSGTEREPPFRLLPKPVFHLYGLLGMLDSRLIAASEPGDGTGFSDGWVVTSDGQDFTVLVYRCSNDAFEKASPSKISQSSTSERAHSDSLALKPVAVRFPTVGASGQYRLRSYQISDGTEGPFETWEALGSPMWPTESQWAELEAATGCKQVNDRIVLMGVRKTATLSDGTPLWSVPDDRIEMVVESIPDPSVTVISFTKLLNDNK